MVIESCCLLETVNSSDRDWVGDYLFSIMSLVPFDFYLIFLKFMYLFLAALGLRCCTLAFSSCGERGLLFVAVCGLLIVVASLVAEHGL